MVLRKNYNAIILPVQVQVQVQQVLRRVLPVLRELQELRQVLRELRELRQVQVWQRVLQLSALVLALLLFCSLQLQ
jgi:hypothetical protein